MEVYTHELDPKQEGAIAASRTPLWLASGLGDGLAGVHRLAVVRVELFLNGRFRVPSIRVS